MKFLSRLALLSLTAIALVAAPASSATAQTIKPVAIVSVASIKENLADISYLTRVAGMEDSGKTVAFFAGALSTGIDRDRPSGMYLVPQAGDFHGVLFIPLEQTPGGRPTTGLDTLLKMHRDQLGEPKDAGNGIREVGKNRTVFIKEENGWAFAAESKEHLANLPPDPAAVLGSLPKQYNVAVKLMVQNVPAELRSMPANELKRSVERFLSSPQARQGNIDRAQVDQLTKTYIANIDKLLNESDEILLGLSIDEAAKRTTLDIGFSAKEGTSLAKQMALQTSLTTNFAGFLLPDASVTLSFVSKTSQEDIEQAKPALAAVRQQWSKQIDDSPDIAPDKREAVKAIAGQFFDVLEKTVATGTMDGAASLLLLPKSVSFVGGGFVADGAGIEKGLQSLVDWGKDQPDFPKVQMNVGSIGNVKLHRLTKPISEREREARDLLGDKLEILIGIGPKSVVVSGGKEAETLLRKALADSAQQANKAVTPLQINIAVLPILKFYRSVDENPIAGKLIAALEQSGSDRVTIVNRAEARSSTTRVEIQEGVVTAIGQMVKSAGARFGGQ